MVQGRSAGNPLCAGSLSLFMATSLPKGEGQQLKNPTEAVALAVHAGMLAVGFRLIGLGEDDRIEASANAEDPRPLPAAWNASSSYAFRYAHPQSAMEYMINVSKRGVKAMVDGFAIGDDNIRHFDVVTKEYLSESMLPITISEDTPTEQAATKLQDLFISSGRLNDLGALFKISIVQKLAPSIHKPGYEETRTDRERTPTAERPASQQNQPPNPRQPPRDPEPARPYPYNDPLAAQPQPGRPLPEPIPGFEDEYEVNRPARGGLRDDRYPVGIGHDDLYPQGLGPNDPLRPHLGPGIPRPGGGFGGGMHPTFDDPLFRGQGGPGGYDPMAPPGARYDPIGPGGAPRDNRGGPRFPGGGGFGGGFGGAGGRPPNPFGGFGDGDFI
ncbi:hypothetical protein P153DRAFT_316726 [Dothidotthia symphoricarpi CBS 119687]|uniref:Uncharacterized protein n=1 Tax=Dothidotthia symphoricarpi CBS 119687 TaxID=1392245 RepID=A0A6A6ACQ0_9PLEO|nr:uncharacterized protein P153DRAFT_316726 [Dothidotthia symphoricarpi CBS 119687]KAF2129599.1 hypothetical protein P153DRAFT_316726 [Dothidotthia symphoricarpi CBS 119687]